MQLGQFGLSYFPKQCKLLVVFLLIGLGTSAYCQTASSTQLEGTGLWYGAYLKMRFHKFMGYYGEHHYRGANDPDNVSSFVGRPSKI